ncbi:hypothetical protein [Tessaracoccus oleiagri]|nr:hypothetical protein [Tessaracoccus oleiagri]
MTTNPGSMNPSHDESRREAARQEAEHVRHQASGAAKDVAHTAKSEAGNVKDEAKYQVRSLADSAKYEALSQASTQQRRLAEQSRHVSDDLQRLARGEQPETGLVQQALSAISDRAERLTRDLENKEPEDLIDDVRRFAARRPGTFLAIAAGIGVVAGRLTRGMKDSHDDQSSQWASTGYERRGQYTQPSRSPEPYGSRQPYGSDYGTAIPESSGTGVPPTGTGVPPTTGTGIPPTSGAGLTSGAGSTGSQGYDDLTRGTSSPRPTDPRPGAVHPGEARGIVDPGERP